MERELILTEDGSHTFFVPGLNENYHSTFGAISESKHIFIENALNATDRHNAEVRILEVGFGTGLNALLTWLYCIPRQIKLEYTAIEPLPIKPEEAKELNYTGILQFPGAEALFKNMHEVPWGQTAMPGSHMKIFKIRSKLEDVELAAGQFDVVYFDAFGPEVQPELWTAKIFSKVHAAMANEAVMTTFSAKGVVRRAMARAGFRVEKLKGPAGKREITRAWKR